MRVLRGSITETRYDYPDGKEAPMQIKKETTLKEGAVAYMADNLGLHQVANPGSDYAVSLHRRYPSVECVFMPLG